MIRYILWNDGRHAAGVQPGVPINCLQFFIVFEVFEQVCLELVRVERFPGELVQVRAKEVIKYLCK